MNSTSFLAAFKTQDNTVATHLLLTSDFGKYVIEDTIQRAKELEAHIDQCVTKKIDFGLVEKHYDGPEPLYLDLDFKHNGAESISEEVIDSFVDICKSSIDHIFDVTEEKKVACIFRRPQNKEVEKIKDKSSKYYKSGVHVMFPYLRCEASHRMTVYEEIVKKVEEAKLFDDLDLLETRPRKIVDECVIATNGVLMLGCNKPKKARYQLRRTIGGENPTDRDLFRLRANIWRPDFQQHVPPIKDGITVWTRPVPQQISVSQNGESNDIEWAREVIGALKQSRSSDRNEWIKVLMILKNEMGDEGYELAKEFSLRGEWKDDEANFSKTWKGLKPDGRLGFGTLIWMFKQDNPDKIVPKKVLVVKRSKEHEKLLLDFTNETNETNAAKLFYYCNKKRYIYSKKMWYQLNQFGVWKMSEEPHQLRIEISDFLLNEMNVFYHTIEAGDDEKTKKMVEKLLKSKKVYGDTRFKTNVIKELRSLYNDDAAVSKMDENRDIFAFDDCLFDCKTGAIRPILPEDFVRTTCGYSYPKTECPETCKEINKFLDDMFDDPDDKKYILCVIASSLCGYKKDESFNIWTGNGANGKSLLVGFIEHVFNDYAASIRMDELTKKRTSSNAHGALANLKGKRFVSAGENESNEKFQKGLLKSITGNDRVSCRAIYQEETSYIPQYQLVLHNNEIPEMECDPAMKRRLRIMPFKNKFVSAEDYESRGENKHYRLGDSSLKSKLTNETKYRDQFILLLIEVYNTFVRGKDIPMPKSMIEETREYVNDNNPFPQFAQDFLEIDRDNIEYFISGADLLVYYNHFTGRKDTEKDLKKNIKDFLNIENKVCGRRNLRGYRGIRVKINKIIEYQQSIVGEEIESFKRLNEATRPVEEDNVPSQEIAVIQENKPLPLITDDNSDKIKKSEPQPDEPEKNESLSIVKEIIDNIVSTIQYSDSIDTLDNYIVRHSTLFRKDNGKELISVSNKPLLRKQIMDTDDIILKCEYCRDMLSEKEIDLAIDECRFQIESVLEGSSKVQSRLTRFFNM